MTTVYLDGCVNHAAITTLERHGFTVKTAQMEGMSAASDSDQLRFAHTNQWLILTTNDREFIGLHRAFHRNQWAQSGIVIVPQTAVIPRLLLRCTMLLDWTESESTAPRNSLFRWTDLQQRLIGGYSLEGYSEAEMALALGRITELP